MLQQLKCLTSELQDYFTTGFDSVFGTISNVFLLQRVLQGRSCHLDTGLTSTWHRPSTNFRVYFNTTYSEQFGCPRVLKGAFFRRIRVLLELRDLRHSLLQEATVEEMKERP